MENQKTNLVSRLTKNVISRLTELMNDCSEVLVAVWFMYTFIAVLVPVLLVPFTLFVLYGLKYITD